MGLSPVGTDREWRRKAIELAAREVLQHLDDTRS